MTNLDIIKTLKESTFKTEDGEDFRLNFDDALTQNQIEELKYRFPNNYIAAELIEILKETRGWDSYFPESIFFDTIGEFGFEEFIDFTISIGQDGLGNFWTLEIKKDGSLGKVFFMSHDPAVALVHSQSLNEYLKQLLEYYKEPVNSYISNFYENIRFKIWKDNPNLFAIKDFKDNNPLLTKFLNEYNQDEWMVADLRNAKNEDGFAWGKHGPNSQLIKHPSEYLWLISKPIKKKNFFSRLFGK